LLIAISLMGVLALLSWRGLDAVMTAREVIVERSQDLRVLSSTMAQIEEDLRRSWPVRLLGIPEQPLGFTIGDDRSPPAMELLREAPGDDPTQVQRVVWRLRDGVLERGFAPWSGSTAGEMGSMQELAFFWQPLVPDVERLDFRGWLADRGWLPAAAIASAVTAQTSSAGRRAPAESPAPATSDASSSPGAGQAQAGEQSPGEALAATPLVTGIEMVLVQRGQSIVRVFSVGH
jgi:general secretion pathway protein J